MNEEQHEVEVPETQIADASPEMDPETANHDSASEHQENETQVSSKEYNFNSFVRRPNR